jgi:hypothetical protein
VAHNNILNALRAACGDFAAGGFARLKPEIAHAIVLWPTRVCISLEPARARLVVEAPNGELRCVYRVNTVKPALGVATAAFVSLALGHLTTATQTVLIRRHAAGQASNLGVIVDQAGACHLTLDDGGELPRILCTLQPEAGEAVAH